MNIFRILFPFFFVIILLSNCKKNNENSSTNSVTINTKSLSSITDNSVTTGGEITVVGNNTISQKGICYAITNNPTIQDNKLIDATSQLNFTQTITGLLQNTTYYIRAFAISNNDVVYGNQLSFTTSVTVNTPSIAISNVNNTTSSSTSVSCQIVSNGSSNLIKKGICYSTNPNPDSSSNIQLDESNNSNFTINLIDLSPNTTFYVRAFAINASGISYSNERIIQTLPFILSTDTAETIYLSGGYSNKLFALKAFDGSIKWSANLDHNALSSPSFYNTNIYIRTSDNKIYKFDENGNLLWKTPSLGPSNGNLTGFSPVVQNGIVYAHCSNNVLYALNISTGAIIWQYTTSYIIFNNSTIYCETDIGYGKVALDPLTGSIKWQNNSLGRLRLRAVVDNYIFLSNNDNGSIDILDKQTGNFVKKITNYGFVRNMFNLNVKYGTIYASTDEVNSGYQGFNALNLVNGQIKFRTYSSNCWAPNSWVGGTYPLFYNGIAFVPENLKINAYNPFTGQLLFEINARYSSGINSSFSIYNNLAYFTQPLTAVNQPNGSTLYYSFLNVYDISTRNLKWSKSFLDTDIRYAAPCVVTKSGKMINGSISN